MPISTFLDILALNDPEKEAAGNSVNANVTSIPILREL